MTILPILPILSALVGVALGGPVSDPPADHPHYYKATVVACVKGKVNLNWYTVPYNAELLKTNQTPNFRFNRGFTMQTDVALKCGDVAIKPGSYSLAFQLDDKAENWNAVLTEARQRGGRGRGGGRQRGGDAGGGRQRGGGGGGRQRGGDGQGRGGRGRGGRGRGGGGGAAITIPMKTFQGEKAEHMNIACVNYGYKTAGRGNPEPASGVEVEMRVSYGDLHLAFKFEEVLEAKKDGDAAEPIK